MKRREENEEAEGRGGGPSRVITEAFAEGIRAAIPAEGEREEADRAEESEGDESGRG